MTTVPGHVASQRHPFLDADDNPHLQHIHACWRQGLARLSPTPEQLERGLALHGEAVALDTFGFLPSVWNERVIEQLNALADGQIGAREWHFRALALRKACMADDPDGPVGQTFVAALRASGLNGMVQTVGRAAVPGMNDLEREMHAMASFQHLTRQFRKHLFQAGSVAELHEGMAEGRFGLMWSMNSPPVPGRMIDADDEFSWLTPFYQMGFRLCHLSYNRRNA
ncbi:MAG: hypothetical protein ACOC9P_02980, partial [bacterium]